MFTCQSYSLILTKIAYDIIHEPFTTVQVAQMPSDQGSKREIYGSGQLLFVTIGIKYSSYIASELLPKCRKKQCVTQSKVTRLDTEAIVFLKMAFQIGQPKILQMKISW